LGEDSQLDVYMLIQTLASQRRKQTSKHCFRRWQLRQYDAF